MKYEVIRGETRIKLDLSEDEFLLILRILGQASPREVLTRSQDHVNMVHGAASAREFLARFQTTTRISNTVNLIHRTLEGVFDDTQMKPQR